MENAFSFCTYVYTRTATYNLISLEIYRPNLYLSYFHVSNNVLILLIQLLYSCPQFTIDIVLTLLILSHNMDTRSARLALYAGNPLVTAGFSSKSACKVDIWWFIFRLSENHSSFRWFKTECFSCGVIMVISRDRWPCQSLRDPSPVLFWFTRCCVQREMTSFWEYCSALRFWLWVSVQLYKWRWA